jgi:type IV secretion system protein VirD4
MDSLDLLAFTFALLLAAAYMERRNFKKRWEKARKFDVPNTHGESAFTTDAEARKGKLLTGKGLWLAMSKTSGRVFRYGGDAHITAIGATGVGKARDWLVALVLTLGPKTLIANDVKGQLMCVTGRARRRIGPTLALNPFGIHAKEAKGVRQVRFNPMAQLTATDPLLAIKCDKIADGLVWDEGGSSDRFFNDGARELLSGLMMGAVELGTPEQKNLIFVIDILCGDLEGFCRLVMQKSTNPYTKMRLAPYASPTAAEDRTKQSIVTTARVNTGFMRNEVLGKSLSASDFTFKELRDKPSTLYLVLPVDASSDVFDRYYRLVMASALAETMSEGCLGKTPVLFLLDEAGQMGYMKSVLQALSIARGYGVQLLSVFTDFPTMNRIYRDGARSFLANSAINMFFGAADTETAEEISKLSGQRELINHTRNVSTDQRTGEPIVNDGASQVGVPLLRLDEVRDLPPDEVLILARGVKGVLKARRKPYWLTHPGKAGKDPYEKGKKR